MRARTILGTALLIVLAVGGCRRVERPAPVETGEALFAQASSALADGRIEDAAALFARSLATADDVRRRRDASVRLFAAGAADAALELLAGRREPLLAATREAMILYAAAPPPGWEDNPYVVGAMSDALAAAGRLSGPVQPLAPTRLGEAALREVIRDWHAWARLVAASANEGGSSRAMLVWTLDRADEVAAGERRLIVHPPTDADGAGWLVHLGSWPAGGGGPVDELATLPTGPDGPVALVLATWDDGPPLTVVLFGERAAGELVVTGCSHPALLAALVATMADPDLAAGSRIRLRDDGERQALLTLVAQLDADEAVTVEGPWATWTAPRADQTDFAVDDRPLADLVGYIRYGLAAWPAVDR